MDKIEKILRSISQSDRQMLEVILELLMKKKFDTLDIKKLKSTNLYRARKGRFRIIFGFDENKEIIIYKIKSRNERTYKI